MGIDNVPVAYFRYDSSETETLDFAFTDLSYFEPANWEWDFGDGNGTIERHPEHSFPGPGVYEVCLNVSNSFGEDRYCRILDLLSTSTKPIFKSGISIYPNPTSGTIFLHGMDMDNSGPLAYAFFNMHGQVVAQGLSDDEITVGKQLPSGVYFLKITRGDNMPLLFEKVILHR